MCPACMMTALLAVTGASALAGATGLLAKKARQPRATDAQSALKPLQSSVGEQPISAATLPPSVAT